ncbi:MAG: stage II sporulation protein M [Oligoflexus sp.]
MDRRVFRLRKLEQEVKALAKKAFPVKGAGDLPATLQFIKNLEQFSGFVYTQRQQQKASQSCEETLGLLINQVISAQASHESEAGYQQWLRNYRLLWRQNLGLFTLATSLFFGCILLGWYLATMRPEYINLLFHQQMQEFIIGQQAWFERIQSNVLLYGYEIAVNNIKVALLMLAGGCLLGIGSIVLLIYNGMHIGSIMGYCYVHNFHDALINFIVAHGPLELSIIVAAAFNGMLVGRCFFQWPYRGFLQRFQQAGKEAFTVALGVIPWLLLAATLEVIVSPFDHFSFSGKMIIGIVASVSFWAWTFWPQPMK